MINFDTDIERFDYAARGEEIRDSLIAMFEHVQEILHDESHLFSPEEFKEWISSGVITTTINGMIARPIMYLNRVDENSNAAVRSDYLYAVLGRTIKLIMQYGDEYERNYWILNQRPGYPAVDPPTPQDIYNPITKNIKSMDTPIEFEPGWFAKGKGKVIYPYKQEYITCEPELTDTDFEIFYEVPIMQYPYLFHRDMSLIHNTTGVYRLRFVFVNEKGDELPINDYNRSYMGSSDPVKDRDFTDVFEPDITGYNNGWKLRIKFSGRARTQGNVISFPRFYIDRIRLMPYEVFING